VSRQKIQPLLRLFRRLFTGIVLCYVATSLTIGGSAFAPTLFHTLATAWALCLCIAHFGHFPPFLLRPIFRPWLLKADLIATNIAFTLVLAELVLNLYGACRGNFLLIQDTLDAYRLVPGKDYGRGLRGNSLGYPGKDFQPGKLPGTKRIAALGDSFAVGPAVPYAENYLFLLETALPGVEIYNFGVSGTGPREYYAILRDDVRHYKPDLVLVSIFVGNDITETMATPRHLDPRRHALFLLATRTCRLAHERLRCENSAIPDSNAGERTPLLSEASFREVEARRLAVCQKNPSPSMEKKWTIALKYLDRIIEECRKRKIPLAFVLIPDEFQANPDVLASAMAKSGLDPEQLNLELPQRRLSEFLAVRHVPCLDLLPAFQGKTDTYEPRDTHWNVRGNRLAATLIADWLESHPAISGALPPPPVP
jgi:hypothetical protein